MKKKLYLLSALLLCMFCTSCSSISGNSNKSVEKVTDLNNNTSSEVDTSERVSTPDYMYYRNLTDRVRMTLGIADENKHSDYNAYAIQPDGTFWIYYPDSGARSELMEDVVDYSVNGNSEYSLNGNNVWVVKQDNTLWSLTRKSDQEFGKFGEPEFIMDDVIYADITNFSNIVIKTDNSLWIWGNNYYGQIGDGTTEDRTEPVKIMDNVKKVASTGIYTAAIKMDGSLWMWGCNEMGQLGDGTTENRYKPKKIMDNVLDVAVDVNACCNTAALTYDGSLYMWGTKIYGNFLPEDIEMSNKMFGINTTPVKMLDDVTCFSVCVEGIYDFSFVMAVKTDGSLWGWGRNCDGELGVDGIEYTMEPVHIMDNIAYVKTYQYGYTIAIGNDESIWIWGNGFSLDSIDEDYRTPYLLEMDNLYYKDGADLNNNDNESETMSTEEQLIESETMSPEEQLMEQRMLLEQEVYAECENEALQILDNWLEQNPIDNQIGIESADSFIDKDNGRYYEYYMLVEGGIYAMLYVNLDSGDMIIDSVEGGYDGGEMPLEQWYSEYVVYNY